MKIDFKILDGIRGIAALYVVINHCRGNLLMGGSEFAEQVPIHDWSLFTKVYYAGLQFTGLGREFVVIFFVLSGFSISHSLKTNSSVLHFYKKRIVRLYLPFLFALLFAHFVFVNCSELLTLTGEPVFDSANSTIYNLLYIPTGEMIPQFWSLTHEVLFYIFAPLILVYNKKVNAYFFVSVMIHVLSTYYNVTGLSGQNIIGNFFLDYQLFFAIGIFVYHHFDRIIKMKIFNKKNRLWLITIIAIPVMIVIKYKLGEFNKISSLISAVYSVFLILFFLRFSIRNRVISFLGKISYTLYITHFAAIYLCAYFIIKLGWIDQQITDSPFVWIIAVPFCVLIAYPFYLVAEYPAKRLLSKMRLVKPDQKS